MLGSIFNAFITMMFSSSVWIIQIAKRFYIIINCVPYLMVVYGFCKVA